MLLLAAGPAVAASPEGPGLAYLKDGADSSSTELFTGALDGTGLRRLVSARRFSPTAPETLSWSGDGSMLAFATFGILAASPTPIRVVGAGGGRPKRVPGTEGGFAPIFAPDGATIAYARLRMRFSRDGDVGFIGISTWLTGTAGGRQVRLTPWRDRLVMTPSSFSPDGSTLALTRIGPSFRSDAIALALSDRSVRPLVRNAAEPVYSPDGTRIAFVGTVPIDEDRGRAGGQGVDLFVRNTSGGNRIRLTSSPRSGEALPSWDPSGERLLYTRSPAKFSFAAVFGGAGRSIIQINADGTCRQRLLGEPGAAYFAAAWQPGPGREAGRIIC